MKRNLVIGAAVVIGLGLLMVLSGALYTIDETEQVIITQFGEPVGEPITEAGLHFKTPFIQAVNRIEKRILAWDGQTSSMPTKDKLYIEVDTFGRWKIVEPLRYYQRLNYEERAVSRLEDILGSETRNAIAKHDLIEVIRSTKGRKPQQQEVLEGIESVDQKTVQIGILQEITKGRSKIEEEIQQAASAKLREFGIDLLDVRFKRINYNPSVVEKIYERMISERQQIASLFRSEGQGEAAKIDGQMQRDLDEIESEAYRREQEIRGQADAQATEIYASAYDQSPESRALYEFVKSMETYRKTIDEGSTILLTTDSDLFKFLKNSAGE